MSPDSEDPASPSGAAVPAESAVAIKELTGRAALSVILCGSPARKTRLLGTIADTAPGPVSYVDTDLLYAGCARSGLCKIHAHTTLLCPDRDTWHRDLAGVISAVSQPSSQPTPQPAEKATVIIDSLNGVYEMFCGSNAAMAANAHLMILGSLARQAGSSVVIGAVAKKRRVGVSADSDGTADADAYGTREGTAGEWVMRPGGRQIPRVADTYMLREADGGALLVRLNPETVTS